MKFQKNQILKGPVAIIKILDIREPELDSGGEYLFRWLWHEYDQKWDDVEIRFSYSLKSSLKMAGKSEWTEAHWIDGNYEDAPDEIKAEYL
jgi:hypothetical protein